MTAELRQEYTNWWAELQSIENDLGPRSSVDVQTGPISLLRRLKNIQEELPRLESLRLEISARKQELISELRLVSIQNRDLLRAVEENCRLEPTADSNFRRAEVNAQKSVSVESAMTVCESKNPTKTRKSSLKKRAFTEITQEQFEGLSASVRGRTKLPEVNSVLADHLVCRLVLHITEWGPDEREH